MAEPLCEFCRVVRAVIYCKSDGAPLCLKCDGCVHAANALARRHLRSLICDRCNSEAAVVRCLDEKLSLCGGCDNSCFPAGHHRAELSFYSGCPTVGELSKVWHFAFEGTDSQQEIGGNEGGSMNEIRPFVKFGQWPIPSQGAPPLPSEPPPKFPYSFGGDQRLAASSFSRDLIPFLPQESTLETVTQSYLLELKL